MDRSYTYCNVPPHVYDSMTSHPSVGQYFHRVIKKRYKVI